MYKQKLTLDPKLAGICEATLTIYDPEPLQQETSEKAGNFKVLGCSKLSDQEMKAHKLMRAAAPLAAGQKDVAVTELKCISVEGDVLPAEFQMHYEFHVANYSDEAIDYLPITIYFNTPDHALVEQDTTTITGIPAGWYQALEFTFPGVVAGQWMMTLEANKSREIVESNYENNKLSKIFTYINQPELVAESIAEVNGRTDFPLNESTEFEFVLSNLGPVDAEHVPIDFPVTFIDNSGRYSNIMASYVVQNIPAQRRSRAGFNITFQKPALCQMKLRIDKDGTINEISRKNNEVASEWYSIDNFKPNPPTGGDEAVDIDLSDPNDVSQIPGRMAMPLYIQNSAATWENIKNDTGFWNKNGVATKDIESRIESIQYVSCGICSLSMIISYMRGSTFTPCDALREGIGNTDGGVKNWTITSVCPGYNMGGEVQISSLSNDVLQTFIDQIVVSKRPILYRATGEQKHFMVISGYEFDPEKVGTSGYASDPYDLSHFKVMDPWSDTHSDPSSGRCKTLADVQKKNHYPTPLYYKLVVDAN